MDYRTIYTGTRTRGEGNVVERGSLFEAGSVRLGGFTEFAWGDVTGWRDLRRRTALAMLLLEEVTSHRAAVELCDSFSREVIERFGFWNWQMFRGDLEVWVREKTQAECEGK